MKSFNQELKNELVAEIIKHREADQLIQGSYGEGEGKKWKCCAVGCAIHSLNKLKGKNISYSSHKSYETEFGIPIILARLEDRIFEGLSVKDSKLWPEQFMNAVPVEADLSMVWNKFAVWLLSDNESGVIKHAKTDKSKNAINKVSKLYLNLIDGKSVDIDEWIAARRAAAAAAYADADADAYAADADAAAAAAADAAYSKAKESHYKKMADKLIEILESTK